MLLLTRNIGEKIIIEGGIEITVTDVQGKSIKIGIDAPIDVNICREEIYVKLSDYCSPPYG